MVHLKESLGVKGQAIVAFVPCVTFRNDVPKEVNPTGFRVASTLSAFPHYLGSSRNYVTSHFTQLEPPEWKSNEAVREGPAARLVSRQLR